MQVCAYFQSHSGRLCAVKYNGDELKGLEEFYIMPRTELYGGNDISLQVAIPALGYVPDLAKEKGIEVPYVINRLRIA